MKRIIKLFSISFLTVLLLQVQLNTALAQGPPNPPPGNPGCPPDCPGSPHCPPRCVPIDGGLSLLIAAGIGIGAKKAYDRRKARQQQ